MTSAQRKSRHGAITFSSRSKKNIETLDFVKDSADFKFSPLQHSRTKHVRVQSATSERSLSRPLSVASNHSTFDHTQNIQDWLSHKYIRGVQEKADPDKIETEASLKEIEDIEKSFVKNIETYLFEKSILDRRKKELLHKKWSERVYEPIRREVTLVMEGPRVHKIDSERRKLYEEYLDYRNMKGHIFLDVIAKEEYDPLALQRQRPGMLKANVTIKRDPLLMQRKKHDSENEIITKCTTKGASLTKSEIERLQLPTLPLVPLGRHGTECSTWLSMPLKDIDSKIRNMSRHRMLGIFNNGEFDFSTWNSKDKSYLTKRMMTEMMSAYNGQDHCLENNTNSITAVKT